jgi:hypothetical protein
MAHASAGHVQTGLMKFHEKEFHDAATPIAILMATTLLNASTMAMFGKG